MCGTTGKDDEVQGDDVEDVDVQGDDVEDKDVEDDEVQGDDVGDEDVEGDGVQGGDVEVDEVEDDHVEDDVKGEKKDDVENDDAEEAENDDTEDVDVEEEGNRSPDNAAGFARACPGSQNACPHVTKVIRRATFYRNLQEKCRRPDWAQNADTHTLCEPAQSKCMSTCHKRHQKTHCIRTFTGKMPRPRLGPERRHTLCASLRSRNACQHFTRAT